MDLESQPLLADVEDNHAPAVLSKSDSDAARSEPQHICARCSSELDLRRGYEPGVNVHPRIALIVAAIILCIAVFIFAVLTLVAARRFQASQVVAAIWADVTIAVLAILVYAGRHRIESLHGGHKLGRTTTQILVLCGLAVSWTVLTVGLIMQNSRACARDRTGCGLFTTAHVLAWLLIVTLFGAAFATYRRAVNIHGRALVPNPAMISAWRLSDIANDGATGAIKI